MYSKGLACDGASALESRLHGQPPYAANGIAKKHGEVSREILTPKDSDHHYQIDHITNGVHAQTWAAPSFANLFDRWLHRDVSKKIARTSLTTCLFVPHGVNGFVAREDGSAEVQNIVVPVATRPDAAGAIAHSWELANQLDCKTITVTLLHVGDEAEALQHLEIPDIDGWTWELVVEDGDPATGILKCAEQRGADLIALTTRGQHGFLDALRGSTSDQVVQRASCPILAVPADLSVVQQANPKSY